MMDAVARLVEKLDGRAPKTAIVLGSGLGGLVERLAETGDAGTALREVFKPAERETDRAVLQSIAIRTLSDSRDVAEARRILVGRLHALARAHELLTEACWKGADLGHIVEAEVSGFSLTSLIPSSAVVSGK